MRICVVGSGYVGLVAAVCFAEIGHGVLCVDNDEAKVSQLNSGNIPIFEEHLPDLFRKHHMRRVEFTSDLRRAVETSDAIFVAVGTPQSSSGAANLCYVEGVVNDIAKYITRYKVIVEKSTVPVHTNEQITQCIQSRISSGRKRSDRFSAP
jgi:UDPglucose 6-dehydrogenase